MQAIIDRMKEPSTWATITAGIAGFLPTVPVGVWTYVAAIGAGLTGLLGVFLAERK